MTGASLLVGVAALAASTAQEEAQTLRFVTCPIYRDTDAGKKSGCWLADDPATGMRYDVSSAPSKPDWNFSILVEGRLDPDGGNPCGGKVLDPVRVSVLDQPCTRFMLEAEGYAGRKFALPRRNVRPLYEVRSRPAAPYAERRFSIPFDFGSSFITYQNGDYFLDQMINYALDVQPAVIRISGHVQTQSDTSSMQGYTEPEALAARRAEVVRQALILRGIDPKRIVAWNAPTEPQNNEAFDGLAGPDKRRVDVVVTPDPAP